MKKQYIKMNNNDKYKVILIHTVKNNSDYNPQIMILY